MHLKLKSEGSGCIPFTSIIPSSLAGYLLPGAKTWSAGWASGELLIQEWDWEPTVRHSTYLFYGADRISITAAHTQPMLQFILQNDFYSQWSGLDIRVHRQWSCNMLALPSFEYTLDGCPAGLYSKIEIFYSIEQLSPVCTHFPALQYLLTSQQQGMPFFLYPEDQPAPASILAAIGELLQTTYHGPIGKVYAGVKSMQILINTLQAFTRNPRQRTVRTLFTSSHN